MLQPALRLLLICTMVIVSSDLSLPAIAQDQQELMDDPVWDATAPSYIPTTTRTKEQPAAQGTTAVTTIDILAAYTPDAAPPNDVDIVSKIDKAVADANASFKKSMVNINFNIVEIMEFDYDAVSHTTNEIIAALKADPAITTARNYNGADIVVLFFGASASGYCGQGDAIGADADHAFAIVKTTCNAGQYVFAHEVGHLFGARHSRQDDNQDTPFVNAHGYQHPKTSKEPVSFRTIMTNPCKNNVNCNPMINYWSNPNVGYQGAKTGTQSSNNALVLNNQAAYVSSFRPTKVDIPIGLPSHQIFIRGDEF